MIDDKKFSLKDIDRATADDIIRSEVAEKLKSYLITHNNGYAPSVSTKAKFNLTNLLWYAGALTIMSAMGLFTTLAFSKIGGGGLTAIGLTYLVALWFAGDRLWRNPDTRTPASLLIATAVAMVPLIIYGIQNATDIWLGFTAPGIYRSFYIYVRSGWIPMELGTILASIFAARRYPFAFIFFPLAFCLWFLSMDMAEYLSGVGGFSFEFRKDFSLWFGIVLFVLTWMFELQTRQADYGFWLHLVAAMTFWSGLTMQESDAEFSKFVYFIINIGLFPIALFMRRWIYVIFGTIGVTIYVGHLAYKVFQDSILFPFALSAFGITLIFVGLLIARRKNRIKTWIEINLPPTFRALRPIEVHSSDKA